MTKLRLIGLMVVIAMIAVACSPSESDSTTTSQAQATTTTAQQVTTTTEAPDELQYDIGVTPAPCADAVNDGNGCIYLGVISDLTVGPFRALGVPITDAQTHFWEAVNEGGGLDGFDVIIRSEDIQDAEYAGDKTAAAYEAIGDRVLALAQTLGTPQTQGIIPRMAEDNTVAAPATWWSGWSFNDDDRGLILESGAPYCLEGMNGMTFMKAAMEGAGFEDITWAMIRFGGDYGGDYGDGASIAAAALEMGPPLFDHAQTSFSANGTPDEAVGLILQHRPDLIIMVTGPTEMATIAGAAFQGGHQRFQILGASPTWNVALTQSPAMPLLEQVYKGTVPWGPWDSDTVGHEKMRAAAAANNQSPNNGYNAGWVWQYPLKALLEEAIATNNLTKANVASIAANLTGVDYEGMLPVRDFAGEPNSTVVRHSWVVQADSTTVDGIRVISGDTPFISPITAAYPYESPCFAG